LAYGNKDSATYKIQLKCGKAWIRIRIEVGIRIHSKNQSGPKTLVVDKLPVPAGVPALEMDEIVEMLPSLLIRCRLHLHQN